MAVEELNKTSPDGQPVVTDPAMIGTQVMLQQKAAKATRLPTSGIASSAVDPNLTQTAFEGNVQSELKKMVGSSPGIVSSEQARNEGAAIDERLNGMSGSASGNSTTTTDANGNQTTSTPDVTEDPLMQLYKRMNEEYDKRLKEEEASLQAQRDRATASAKKANENNVGAAQLALLRSGGFSAMSGQDYLYSLVREGQMKLADIDRQYLDAMRKARDARTDVDFKLANLSLERADKLKKDFIEEKQRQIDNMLKFEQIEKLRRDSYEATVKSWSDANLDPDSFPQGYLDSIDAARNQPAGVTYALLEAANIKREMEDAKTQAELEQKAADAIIKIQEARLKLPKGQSFFVGGVEYTGLASSVDPQNVYTDVEINEDGMGTLIMMQKGDVSTLRVVPLGHVGKAADGWINAFDAEGNSYRYNTNTSETKPVEIKGSWINPANIEGFESWLSSVGDGKVTTKFGDKTSFESNHPGWDVDGKLGDEVHPFFPPDVTKMTVVSTVIDQKANTSGYGNQVVLRDDRGRLWHYNHLQEGVGVKVVPGQEVTADTVIGLIGNTGSVVAGEGGDGSHLDVRVQRPTTPLSTKAPEAPKATIPGVDVSNLSPELKSVYDQGQALISTLTGDYKQKAARNTLAGFLKAGDAAGANRYLHTLALDTMGETEKRDFKAFETAIEASKQAMQFITQKRTELQKGTDVGPYKALIEGNKTYLNVEKDPAYATLRQWTGLADAQIRRGYFGVAVTATEAGTATSFLFDPTDDLNTVERKIKGTAAFFEFVNDVKMSDITGGPRPVLDDYLIKYGLKTAADWKASLPAPPAGEIWIKRNGEIGSIPPGEFNPATDVK